MLKDIFQKYLLINLSHLLYHPIALENVEVGTIWTIKEAKVSNFTKKLNQINFKTLQREILRIVISNIWINNLIKIRVIIQRIPLVNQSSQSAMPYVRC